MNTEIDRQELLEIYKLHADLTDRVSQRREGANRIHVSLQVGLGVFLAALMRFGSGDFPAHYIIGAVGLLGFFQAVIWYLVIESYRTLNREKFRVLNELESHLPFKFYSLEWDPKDQGRRSNRYVPITTVESIMPYIFMLLWLVVLVYVASSLN